MQTPETSHTWFLIITEKILGLFQATFCTKISQNNFSKKKKLYEVQHFANAEDFAQAYLYFILFFSAIKKRSIWILRNLKKLAFLKLNIFCLKEKKFLLTKIPLFQIFLTHYYGSLNRYYLPETSLCFALNKLIDVLLFFLFK